MTSCHTLRTAIAACAFISSVPGILNATTIGYLQYSDHGTTITIDRMVRDAPDLVIPATIDGKPVTAIGSQAFITRTFKSATLPSSIRSIGSEAFSACRSMTTINIPDGITAISPGTFNRCARLQSITLPSSVTTIGSDAFLFAGTLQKVTMPGVVTIEESAFSRCPNLTSITLPASLKSIGYDAFSFSGLEKVAIPAGVTSVGDSIFSNSNELSSVTFESGFKQIGNGMFSRCKGLGSVTLPDSVTAIGDHAFEDSTLSRIRLGSGVTRIGASAFANSKLTSIEFGPKVRKIGEKAFYLCTGLKTVEFPKSVKSIGADAFTGSGGRRGLSSAVFNGAAPEIGKGAFKDAPSGFKIFIEDGATGFTTPRWNGYTVARPSAEIVVEKPDGIQFPKGEGQAGFGDLLIGGRGEAMILTIRNVGIRNLTGLRAITKGGHFQDFTIKNLSKTTIKPGKTATLRLVFQPKKQGLRSTKVRILSNDADENPFDIKLTGRGLELLD